ncbi:hypothetical protein [Helicobacter mesocricetorum]|uniref:hypothetical protein n=1 Tax=Helicobacter mesocricetorum TaxID=87012 RepID=UPI0013153256|nr:hypothetical protein [Helicobacter mesocricetorum]
MRIKTYSTSFSFYYSLILKIYYGAIKGNPIFTTSCILNRSTIIKGLNRACININIMSLTSSYETFISDSSYLSIITYINSKVIIGIINSSTTCNL